MATSHRNENPMKRWQSPIFLGCVVIGAALACPGPAIAKQRRISAATCFMDSVNIAYDQIAHSYYYLFAFDFSSFACPMPEDSYLPASTVVSLNVQVYDGNDDAEYSQAVGWACVAYDTVTGGECGATDSSGTSFVGNDSLHPDLTYWASAYASDFPYLWVRLPDQDVASSTLRGIYIDDT